MSFFEHLEEALEEPEYWLPAPPPAPPIPMWISNFIWDKIVPENSSQQPENTQNRVD